MRFKIDENLPTEAADLLRGAGYDAMTVYEQSLVGGADPRLAEICREEGRVLISLDQDFADIRQYPPREFAGIIVLRLKQQDKPYVLGVFDRLLRILKLETPEQRLWIVDERRLRIRS